MLQLLPKYNCIFSCTRERIRPESTKRNYFNEILVKKKKSAEVHGIRSNYDVFVTKKQK